MTSIYYNGSRRDPFCWHVLSRISTLTVTLPNNSYKILSLKLSEWAAFTLMLRALWTPQKCVIGVSMSSH